MNRNESARPRLEIFILAGGLSSRMGRDKSRLRLGRRTMLRHVREAARRLGFSVRVIRRDAVPRCGPLGGVVTALKRSRSETVMLLACDMPLVSPELLWWLIGKFGAKSPALFISEAGRAGFPCLLRRGDCAAVITEQISLGEFSLQALAKRLGAKLIRPPRGMARQLTNINTPGDLQNILR